MKVELKPVNKPDVVITLTWDEARNLRTHVSFHSFSPDTIKVYNMLHDVMSKIENL